MIIPAIFGITTVKRDCPERANLRIMRKETNLKQNDMTKKLLMMAMLLSAFAFAVPASGQDDNVTVVIDENFDSFTEGSEDAPATTDIGGYSGKLKKLGWSSSCTKVYEAGGKLKVAGSGILETDYLKKAVSTQVLKITARVRAAADYGEAITFAVGYSFSKQVVFNDNKWHEVTVYVGSVSSRSRLKITPLLEGFFIDEIKAVTSPTIVAVPEPELPSQADGVSFTAKWNHDRTNTDYLLDVYSKADNGSKEYVLKDEVVKPLSQYGDITKKVEGLDASKTYYYTVRGRNKNGNVSDYSDEIEVIRVLKSIDAPKAIAATSVTATSFRANWEAVAEAKRYAVNLTKTTTLQEATTVKVLDDDFAKVTKGSLESVEFGLLSEFDSYTKTPGWHAVFFALASGYMVLSPYGDPSTLTTPALDLTADNGACTVNFNMAEGAYGQYTSGSKVTVSLYDTNPNASGFEGTPVESKTVTTSKGFADYKVEFTKGAATSYIMFSYENGSTTNKIFFDAINVEQKMPAGAKVTTAISVNETEDTYYDFTIDSPEDNTVYNYTVNAIGQTVVDGELADLYSNESNKIEVSLSGSVGIDNVDNQGDVVVKTDNGTISVSLATAGRIAVYDLTGRLIAQTYGKAGANTLSVAQRQVVVVRAANKSFKLAL